MNVLEAIVQSTKRTRQYIDSKNTSWNDLSDRPFWKKNDTLTWDGDTTGREVSSNGVGYHVSDIILTEADLTNGGTLLCIENGLEETMIFTSENITVAETYIVISGFIVIALEDDCALGTVIYPKAGIYFAKDNDFVLTSLTINDYAGFPDEIKTIDFNYLSESLRFGEIKNTYGSVSVVDGVLTWDGNTSGLEKVDMSCLEEGLFFYRVSDETPTYNDFIDNGFAITYKPTGLTNDTTMTFSSEETETSIEKGDDCMAGYERLFIITETDNVVINNVKFPLKGLYFARNVNLTSGGKIMKSLTINNYTFTDPNKTDLIQLENKYLAPIETVGTDTLTWDGDTSGLVSDTSGILYKVSDVLPTIEDFADGASIFITVTSDEAESGEGDIPSDEVINEQGALILAGSVWVITETAIGIDFDGLSFSETGLYLINQGGKVYVSSLTINGYTGFTKEVLKEEYLPEHSHSWNDLSDRPFYETDPITTELANGTFESYDLTEGSNLLYAGLISETEVEFEVGENIKVVYDNVEYNLTVKEGNNNVPYIGNYSIMDVVTGETSENTGEPFLIHNDTGNGLTAYVTDTSATEHTVSIYRDVINIVKIDKKFLPEYVGENVAGKEYTIDSSAVIAGDGAEIFNDYVNNIATGDYSHAEGNGTTASGACSHVEGCNTTALDYQHAQGHYNDTSKATANSSSGTSSGTAFVIGNGTVSAASNAFRVTGLGQVIGKSAYQATGADYAEFFEWEDQNPDNEDRVGYFVTFSDGRYIKKAEEGDYILGVVSGNPCVLGNNDECWMGRYEMDEWNRFVYEDIEEVNEETGEINKYTFYKTNPDFDSDMKYVHRQDRKEWDAVGIVGVLSVRDDGTCQVNGYCKCTAGGIATSAERGSDTYRVIERVTDNIVRVVFK